MDRMTPWTAKAHSRQKSRQEDRRKICDLCLHKGENKRLHLRSNEYGAEEALDLCPACFRLQPWKLFERKEIVLTELWGQVQSCRGPNHACVKNNWDMAVYAVQRIETEAQRFMHSVWHDGLCDRAKPTESYVHDVRFSLFRFSHTKLVDCPGWEIHLFAVNTAKGEVGWLEGLRFQIADNAHVEVHVNCKPETASLVIRRTILAWRDGVLMPFSYTT